MPARIGKREIGPGEPTFVVLEAGPTHTGLESAMRLAEVASEARADAIKFQVMDVDRLMADRKVPFQYKVLSADGSVETVQEPLYDILKRRELTKSEWRDLKAHCDSLGLEFISTFMFPDELDFLVDELGVSSVKLASGDINHLPLIRKVAGKGVNVQMDTGSADIWEIERAVSVIEQEAQGGGNIIIHLCPTGYPARLDSIHLRMIETLNTLFEAHAVAFSDHTPGWEMDIAAIALGASLVEKTLTMDRTTRSCEHMFSLEPHEAASFVRSIRELETALGNRRRTIPPELREARKNARRSIHLMRDMKAGETLGHDDLDYKRPGTGIPPDEAEFVVGKALARDMQAGEMLLRSDLS